MWLRVLEGTFGFLFVLGVVTQIIWPLLTDAPLFPLLHKQRKRSHPPPKPIGALANEKTVEGKIVDRQRNPTPPETRNERN